MGYPLDITACEGPLWSMLASFVAAVLMAGAEKRKAAGLGGGGGLLEGTVGGTMPPGGAPQYQFTVFATGMRVRPWPGPGGPWGAGGRGAPVLQLLLADPVPATPRP